MTDSFHDFIDSLAGDPIPTKVATKVDTRTKFPCGQCAGTGKWAGGMNRYGNTNCIACKGKGYFLSSPGDRYKARVGAATRKVAVVVDKMADFKVAHPDMYAELSTYKGNNGFLLSLWEGAKRYGSPTENQIAAYYRGKAKLVSIIEAKEKATISAPVIDLTPIREMFEKAVVNGYKRPTYRAEGLVISRAPSTGSNPGALYVKGEDNDAYYGKVIEVKFMAVREAPTTVAETLAKIAIDPLAAALRYGRRTGKCACCGRTLTAGVSIDLGIGPICKERWGL